MFLERISNFFTKNKKKIAFYVIFAFLFYMISWDFTFAATATDDTTKRVSIWNWIIAWLSAILWVGTYLATMLLDPNFTSGNLFGINPKLHELWILISNVVYFVFAFILIWIAFMNIIWKADKWELKQAMPKFIIWVLIVPFSWFFVTLIVSIANLLTFAALSLPSDTFSNYKMSGSIPKICTLDLRQWDKKDAKTQSWQVPPNKDAKTQSWQVPPKKDDSKSWIHCSWKGVSLGNITKDSIFWLISTYTYWLLNLKDLGTITKKDTAKKFITTTADLIIYIIFSWIFVLIYAILIMTLIIVLLVRVFYLWLYLALSPLFWLAYFFWKDSSFELFKKFNISEFIALAMVPVYTTLALSFWFVFLSVTMTWLTSNGHPSNKKIGSLKDDKFLIDSKGIQIKYWNNKDGTDVIRLNIKSWWAFANVVNWVSSFAGTLGKGALWFVWTLIMNVFGVTIFWIAIMAALQSSTITKEIVSPIKQFGDSVWSLVTKAPQYAPVFGGQSMQSMSNAASTLSSSISWKQSQKWADFARKFYNWDKVMQAIQDWFRWVNKNNSNDVWNAIKKVLPKVDFKTKAHVDEFIKELIKMWYDKDKLKESTFMTWSKTEIARMLMNAQTWAWGGNMRNVFSSYWDYMKAMDANIITWKGDNLFTNVTTKQYDNLNTKDWWQEDNNTNLKILKSKNAEYWEWTIVSLNENWSWAKQIIVKFQDTSKEAKVFRWNDLKEVIELYNRLWSIDKLKIVLNKLWFDNYDKLSQFVEKEAEEKI